MGRPWETLRQLDGSGGVRDDSAGNGCGMRRRGEGVCYGGESLNGFPVVYYATHCYGKDMEENYEELREGFRRLSD